MSSGSAYDQIACSDAQHASAIATRQSSPAVIAKNGVAREEPAELGRLAATLVRLLEDASKAIYRDCDAARACIARPSALLRDVGPKRAPVTLVRGGLALWQILRVKAHPEAHLDSTIRLQDLAAIAHLSIGHFSHAFTRSFGVTPFAYVAGRRLVRAQDLMLTTDDPLCQIALACGLCDQSHLVRLFRRHVGTSPSAWRRRHRSGLAAPIAAPSASSPKLKLSRQMHSSASAMILAVA